MINKISPIPHTPVVIVVKFYNTEALHGFPIGRSRTEKMWRKNLFDIIISRNEQLLLFSDCDSPITEAKWVFAQRLEPLATQCNLLMTHRTTSSRLNYAAIGVRTFLPLKKWPARKNHLWLLIGSFSIVRNWIRRIKKSSRVTEILFAVQLIRKKIKKVGLGDFKIVSAGKFSCGGRVNELHPATVLKHRMPSPFYASPLYRAATPSRNAAILFSLLKLSFLQPFLQSHFQHQDRTRLLEL